MFGGKTADAKTIAPLDRERTQISADQQNPAEFRQDCLRGLGLDRFAAGSAALLSRKVED